MVTVVTKSIGTTGRDFSTLALFEADITLDLVAADEQWTGECFADSEFTAGITIAGQTVDSTRFIRLTAAAGESALDDDTNNLTYDASNGVAITSNAQSVISLAVGFCEIDRLQVRVTARYNLAATFNSGAGLSGNVVTRCIFLAEDNERISTSRSVIFINCLFIRDHSSSASGPSVNNSSGLFNCTSVVPSDHTANNTGVGEYAGTNTVKNVASFGWGTAFDTGFAAASDFNASDDTTGPGSNSVDSLTYVDQFAATTGAQATLDFRLKSGNSLDGAGTPDTGNTGGIDIFGNSRDATNPSIGCFETQAAVGGASLLLMQQSFRQ